MPDIAMCKDDTCSLHDKCYRFTATPSEYQYWFDSPRKDDECEYFRLDDSLTLHIKDEE